MTTKDKVITIAVATFVAGIGVAFCIALSWTFSIIFGH